MTENGAFFWENLLKMGQNALKKGVSGGKNAEMTRKGSKEGIYWGNMTENGAFWGEKLLKMGENA